MKLFSLIVSMFLVGCLEINYDTHTPYVNVGIDDEFHKYVLYFEENWGRQVTNTSMIFVYSLDKSILADTTIHTSELKTLIRVDRGKWLKNKDDGWRKALILHELGHAVLLREHTMQPEGRQISTSLMQPYITAPLVVAFEANPQAFLDELFDRHTEAAALIWECRY